MALFLNNVVRSALLAKSKAKLGNVHVEAVAIIAKAHMFPASNSTLYYEQAINQLTEFSKHGVFDVPVRLVGLFSELGREVPAMWNVYPGRYSRAPTKSEPVKCILRAGTRENSICTVEIIRPRRWKVGGATGTIARYDQGCGNVHFAPNARAYYDENDTEVLSSCETFGGQGARPLAGSGGGTVIVAVGSISIAPAFRSTGSPNSIVREALPEPGAKPMSSSELVIVGAVVSPHAPPSPPPSPPPPESLPTPLSTP